MEHASGRVIMAKGVIFPVSVYPGHLHSGTFLITAMR